MITIVNIIPKSLSNETHQDSEPNLTINPARPRQLCATAFTPNPAGGPNAPIYVSSDGGATWSLNAIVPGGSSTFGTGDITVRFATSSSELYAGDLRGDGYLLLNALRTNAFLTPTTMSVLESRGNIDQPWVQAATVGTGPDTGKDRLYVGNNDFSAPNRQTATIDQSLNALAAAPAFTSVRVEKRATAGQDGPQVRMTVHPDGTVYAGFYGWRSFANGKITSDVVVVRDDAWGTGASPFTALVDPGDNVPGVRVSKTSMFMFGALLGQQRTGGDLFDRRRSDPTRKRCTSPSPISSPRDIRCICGARPIAARRSPATCSPFPTRRTRPSPSTRTAKCRSCISRSPA